MKICICDDDAVWRLRCREMLAQFGKKHELALEICEFPSGDALLFEAELVVPGIDILLLDIMMPGTDGLQVAQSITESGFAGIIVFLSQTARHYAEAFDVHAYNYIVKEETESRFESVLLSAVDAVRERSEEYISFSCAGVTKNLRMRGIEYFEVTHALITVHYEHGQSFEFYSTMDKLSEKLFGRDFLRVHRSFIVNLRLVKEKHYNELMMDSGAIIPLGRGRNTEINAELQRLHKL